MMTGPILHRRTVLAGGCIATLLTASPRALAAPASGGRKLAVVILRGAMDGLAALPKLDDTHIRDHRAALIDANARPLGEGFALHSAMPDLAALYAWGKAAFAPAVAGPWRERSHFEAQDLLECGATTAAVRDGWLNRALLAAPETFSAVSIGPVQPLILRGSSQAVSSWSPAVLPEASDDTIARLLDLYAGDPVLAPALAAATEADRIASAMGEQVGMSGGRGAAAQYEALMSAAGRFLAQPDGPAIAVVSLDGWDTHAGQNQALNQRFAALDRSITAFKRALGQTWDRTAMIAVSEFGRTVRVNGGGGTDHGTAGLAILAGGAVKGGRMAGGWPTLKPAALFEGRDLAPTLDMRALFKGLMRDHLGWDRARLDTDVFPDSRSVGPLEGLVNSV
jgi:uncharacterized protein (DUF1501 family)